MPTGIGFYGIGVFGIGADSSPVPTPTPTIPDVGSQANFLARIKDVLPSGWFPDSTPVLDGLLSGPAYAWAWIYALIAFVKLQARRLTASGIYLDLIAADFFGTFIKRRVNESDAGLSQRIGKELFREKGTRAGLIAAIKDLTGNTPTVFEPSYPLDTGAYNTGSMGYGVAGAYGSLMLPNTFFMTIFRPTGQGVADVAGYGHIGGFNGMSGGYGVGAFEYANPSMFAPTITDAEMYAVVNDVRPVASTAWVKFSALNPVTAPLDAFVLDISELS